MHRDRRHGRHLTAISVGLLLILLLPMAVLAHAELVESTPAADSMVDGPFVDPIVMTFSEGVVGESGAKLRDSASGDEIDATSGLAGDTMMLTPAAALTDGEFEVEWTAIADDGHIERGTIRFTVVTAATPGPIASPTPTPTPKPVATAAPSATASATPSPAATASPAPTPVASAGGPDGSDTNGGGDVLLPIVLGALLVGGLAVLLFRRRDSSSTTP